MSGYAPSSVSAVEAVKRLRKLQLNAENIGEKKLKVDNRI